MFLGNKATFSGIQSTFLGIETVFLGINLKKNTFLVIRYSVGVLSVFSRSSVGRTRQGIRELKETAILTKVLF